MVCSVYMLIVLMRLVSCRELDHAMLRRLEKRILVDLPSQPARLAMLKHHLPPVTAESAFPVTTDIDYEGIAQVSVPYLPNKTDILV